MTQILCPFTYQAVVPSKWYPFFPSRVCVCVREFPLSSNDIEIGLFFLNDTKLTIDINISQNYQKYIKPVIVQAQKIKLFFFCVMSKKS